MEQQEIKCPKCDCAQITANKKGFSGAKAVTGALLTGGIGLLAGTIGSSNVMITCLGCGYSFKAGNYHKLKARFEQERKTKEYLLNWVKKIFKIG